MSVVDVDDDYVNEDKDDSPLDAGDSQEREKKSKPSEKQTKPPVRPRPTILHVLGREPYVSVAHTYRYQYLTHLDKDIYGYAYMIMPRYGFETETTYSSTKCGNRGNATGASVEDDDNSSSVLPGSSGSTSQYRQEPSDRSFVQQVSLEEMMIGQQARLLLNLFIQDSAENTPVEPIIRDVCQADRTVLGHGHCNESLSDIAITLRRISDGISQDEDLMNFIQQVPIHSTREIFMKVCLQIFQDGNLNWGRIVVLFYFAYRLIIRTITKGMDNVPWIRDLITWAVEFIVKHVAKWIYNRGGWTMIKEWFGISNQTWMLLSAGSMAVILLALASIPEGARWVRPPVFKIRGRKTLTFTSPKLTGFRKIDSTHSNFRYLNFRCVAALVRYITRCLII